MKKLKIKDVFSYNGVPYMNDPQYKETENKRNFYLISPDAYIAKCAIILDMSVHQITKTRLNDKSSYRYIEQAAGHGTLTIPILDYETNNQDGLHRAMWAKTKGMKQIPVFILKKKKS